MLEARYMIDKLGFLMSLCTKQWGIDWACRIIEFAPKAVVLFRLFLWLWRRIIESSMTQQEEIRTRKWMGVQGPGWKFFVLVQNWSRDISIYNLKNLKKKSANAKYVIVFWQIFVVIGNTSKLRFTLRNNQSISFMTLLYPAQGYTCWCSLKLLLQQLLKRGLKMHTWEPRGPDSEHRPFGPIRILRKRFMQMHISAKTEKLSFVRLSKGESRQHFINVQSEFWITNQTRNPRQFAITRHVRWWYMSDKVWVISIRTYEQEKNFPHGDSD